jgi:hypothetical protein
MLISGFSFIRNGIKLHYPFLESIQSALPLCNEFIIAIGNSDDGTKKAIEKISSPKIKIIDTVWDEQLREGGKILAQQTNIALDEIKSSWGFYLQGDEVIHENDIEKILFAAKKFEHNDEVDGLLFSYLHFYGNYNFVRDRYNKRAYSHEIRLIKNNSAIRSYRDAQGFRKYSSAASYLKNDEGEKLSVVKINATIYHYGMVRQPEEEIKRQKEFHKLWHSDETVKEKVGNKKQFEYNENELLEPFTGNHPTVMQERIKKLNWNFEYDKNKVKEPLKYKIQNRLGKLSGRRFFDYRNYKIIGEEIF